MNVQPASAATAGPDRRFSVAPMMACTDRHDRYLMRLISQRALLYTEMVTTPALTHGKRFDLLEFDPSEHPVAVQFGGNDPAAMAECARHAEARGYDEININVGCPSDRVRSGCFGAALMAEPDTVARCVGAMRQAVEVPVTVKTRIGIDELDSYEHLRHFVNTVANAGCEVFIIHARKAWLRGLSPRENREIPPLRYDVAARLVEDFPRLHFVLNGGISDLAQAERHLRDFHGVMLGRAVYADPFVLSEVDSRLFADAPRGLDRDDVLDRYLEYVERELGRGVALRHLSRHLIGLYLGQPGARYWRRYLSEHQSKAGADGSVIERARASMRAAAALASESPRSIRA